MTAQQDSRRACRRGMTTLFALILLLALAAAVAGGRSLAAMALDPASESAVTWAVAVQDQRAGSEVGSRSTAVLDAPIGEVSPALDGDSARPRVVVTVQVAVVSRGYDTPVISRVDATVTRIVGDESPQVSAGVGESARVAAEVVGTSTTPARSLVTPSRVAQDIAVNSRAPAALPTSGRSIGRASHNRALQQDIANLPSGARDIRVNQQQVNAAGQRVGINRPDLQYTIDGRRYCIEYEGIGSPRGPSHTTRIIANDPDAVVIVREVP